MVVHGQQTLFDVAVIGAGIAGLTCAALLAKDGFKVILFEAHDKPGGCAGYFQAGEFQFPVGATAVLGLEAQGLHRQTFELLGIEPPPAHAIDELKVILPDREISIAHEMRRWRRERRRLGGHLRGQEVFWKLQEMVADAGWRTLARRPRLPLQNLTDVRTNLGLLGPDLLKLGPAMGLTAGELMRLLGIHHDHAFRALVDLQLIITSQNSAEGTPFLNAAAGLDLWRHGAFHPVGGTGTLGRALAAGYTQVGGTLQYATRVQQIKRCGEEFRLQTTTGTFHAAKVIANVPRELLRNLIDLPVDSIRTISRQVKRSGSQWGAVNVYCAVRDEMLPADLPLHSQILLDYNWNPGDGQDCFLSLSLPGDMTQAPAGWRALNVSTHTRLAEWEKLSIEQYKWKKREWREKLLQGVRRAIPEFDQGRKFIITATPATWERYCVRRGVGGYPLNRWNSNLFSMPSLVENNLWIVGDTTFPGQGTVACALSGINVWREILAN